MDYEATDDITLIRLIARRRPEALSALYDRHGRLVFSLALTVVDDSMQAEEITQDVFLRVWDNAGAFREEHAKVSTWLTRIARNRAIDVLRRHAARVEGHAVDWTDSNVEETAAEGSPDQALELDQQKKRVRTAVAQLPEDQKRVLSLVYFKGYTHQEAARHLNEPLGTVKTRIRLAVQRLRTLLQGD